MGVDLRRAPSAVPFDKRGPGGPIRRSGGAGGPYSGGVKIRPLPLLFALAAGAATAQPLDAELGASLQRWTLDRAGAAEPRPGARVEVELGQLDPRLKLAPCAQIEPYLPVGSRPWGRTRVGLRCQSGPTRWNVFLPITVRVWAPALVLREPLPAGTEITPEHLTEAEVDWAERPAAPLAEAGALVGRTLVRPLSAGQALRDADLQRPVWFAAGDRVKLTALGPGYRVSTEGQALSRGLDGQAVRVRTEGGRIVTGKAVADREVEVML
jgi:flagella basal body P-ring formation protein FlgA